MKRKNSILGLLLFAGLATHAATYNIYFNNTEQGPNSQANPSMTVTGVGAPPAAKPSPGPAVPSPVQAAPPVASPNVTVQTAEVPHGKSQDSHWTFTGLYGVSSTSHSTGFGANLQGTTKVYTLSLGRRVHRTFSFALDASFRKSAYTVDFSSGILGSSSLTTTDQSFMTGLSAEWLPITIHVGSHRLIEAGPIAQFHYDFEYEKVTPSIGARAIVNFAPSVGAVASYKRSFSESHHETTPDQHWVEAGLRLEW